MKRNITILLLLFPFFTLVGQTKAIAHRGVWKAEGSAQNSIKALELSYEMGVYGSEFDVLMTQDGVLVVNHDYVFQEMGIQESVSDEVLTLSLNNGEDLPTLRQYLEKGKALGDIQLILELKPLKTKELENAAVAKIIEMVKELELESYVDYISFSINVCKEIRRLDPGAEISYLKGNLSPKEIFDLDLSGIDYHQNTLLNDHPEWIDEAKNLGLTVNVWTVNDEKVMKQLIKKGVDYITTDEPLTLLNLLEE